ncbi:dihydrolipoamide acetyltransferase family protein [Gimesia algae]|uniref:Dihydrolipoamide acetyltransferase component of pyruvate dehydrogenase complex n=1 Tax=Gimesia algae TaxID=2527971 RepID=A0A517VKZ4_9PLAN|nr:dihydrolipoamide acetyltransferase family protein [Gimesia algae]QDT93620.1 Dihydrolipoyllysine-residue acetyltransferase component of pyruvate dehydrogenase complex [Gimesia algae]
MKQAVPMPALSDTMATGRLVRWLKQSGDPVKRGDVLAEVETDKAVLEVESFVDGFLAGPLAPIETDIPVRQTIGYLIDSAEEVVTPSVSEEETEPKTPPVEPAVERARPAKHPATPSTTAPRAATSPSSPSITPRTLTDTNRRPASPYARMLAADLGIDLADVVPGAGGTIHAAEVLATALQPRSPDLHFAPPYQIEPLSPMHRAVADSMTATRGTPTFRVTARIPLDAIQATSKETKTSLTLLLARACALTVKEFPRFNACHTPGGLAIRDRVDVGIAVDFEGGLLTPVLRDAANRPLEELAEDWRILRDKVRRRRVVPEDYQGATFYVSNLGTFSFVHSFEAIVPLGAAAILAIGADDGTATTFTMSCDHRVVFGADSARFLEALAGRLGNPGSWLG